MGRILNTVVQKASWKKAVLFAVLFAALYALVNFSRVGVSGLLEITGGANILDFEIGYSYEKAFAMLTALGAEGRLFYQTKMLPMDFFVPVTYMLCFAGFIALLLRQAWPERAWGSASEQAPGKVPERILGKALRYCRYLLFVPVVAMLSDWAENIGILVMLHSYPDLPAWAVFMASMSGVIKAVFISVSISVIVLLFLLFLHAQIRRKLT